MPLPFAGGHSCRDCLLRLGQFLTSGRTDAALIFPALHDPDDDEPEPVVRLPDGRRVELRQHTAEMKKDLTAEQRAELANTYLQLGLFREALLEAGAVLAAEPPPEVATKVLSLVFTTPLGDADAVPALRQRFLPN